MSFKSIIFSSILLLSQLPVQAQWDTAPPDAVSPRWREHVPEVIHPDSSLVNL